MTPIFVDTSAFVALSHRRDKNHGAAKRFLKELADHRRPLVTSTYILDELFTVLRIRTDHATAVTAGEKLAKTRWCRIVDVGDDTRVAARQLFVRYDDQVFSFTDCTSFALMQAMELDEAFTFDRGDFAAAGFTPLPRPSPAR